MASDGAIPDMASLFGARLVDRAINSEITLKIVAPFGGFETRRNPVLSSAGAGDRILGCYSGGQRREGHRVDHNNRPALVGNELGRGKTMLSAYPLEHYIANVPAAFDGPEDTHRIYAAFRDWAGIKPAFRVDQPSVEAAALNGIDRGYVVLVNHSAEPHKITVITTKSVHSINRITPQTKTAVQMNSSSWNIALDAYEGTILEWQ